MKQYFHMHSQQIVSGSLLGLMIAIPMSASLRSIFFISSILLILLTPSQYPYLRDIFKKPFIWFSIGLFYLAFLGCFWGDANISEAMIDLEKYIKFLCFPVLIAGFSSRTFRYKALHVYLLVMLVITLLSYYKWLDLFPFLFLTFKNPDPGSVVYNHIITGMMVAFAAYLSAWFLWVSRKNYSWPNTLVYLFSLIFFTFQTFFIGTGRTGYFIYAMLMGVFLLQILPWRKAMIALLAGSFILMGLFYQSPIMQEKITKMGHEFTLYQQGGDKNTSIGFRMQFHEFSESLLKKNWFFGNGTGGFMHGFSQEQPVPAWGERLFEPHSQYWLILSEWGIVGFIVFGLFLCELMIQIMKLKEMRILAIGIFMLFITGSFTDSLFYYSTTGIFFMTIMALCLGEMLPLSENKNSIEKSFQAPIDVVITWVDGNDPKHQEKLANFLAQQGIERPEAAAPTRFNECGELDYCVKSILKFAPWVRTIFIVTDNQIPPIIAKLAGTADGEKIKLIDHRDIFSDVEQYLPTFNSLTIESVLWRIKGLSDTFIYFNDDFLFIRPVSYDDFLKNNHLVLRGKWQPFDDEKYIKKALGFLLNKKLEINKHVYLQEKSAKLAGFNRSLFELPHVPCPLNKKTMEDFCRQHPELLLNNIQYALRDPDQFWMVSLAQHLEIKKSKVIYDRQLKLTYINPAIHPFDKMRTRLKRAEKNPRMTFLCIQSLDEASKPVQEYIFAWLNKLFSE